MEARKYGAGGYRLRASLSIAVGDRVFHTGKVSFRFTRGEIEDHLKELKKLVRRFNAAPKVRRVGRRLEKREAKRKRAESARREAASQRSYDKWHEEVLTPCVAPQKPSACEPLGYWLEEHQGDDEIVTMWIEGNRVLRASKDSISRLRDEAAWLAATHGACLEEATEDTCATVKGYLKRWPHGEHAADAKAALDNLASQSKARAAAREAKERREGAAEASRQQEAAKTAKKARQMREKQRASEQCRKGCGNKCGGVLERDKFNQCVSKCNAGCP